jgi:hypothetical protein
MVSYDKKRQKQDLTPKKKAAPHFGKQLFLSKLFN